MSKGLIDWLIDGKLLQAQITIGASGNLRASQLMFNYPLLLLLGFKCCIYVISSDWHSQKNTLIMIIKMTKIWDYGLRFEFEKCNYTQSCIALVKAKLIYSMEVLAEFYLTYIKQIEKGGKVNIVKVHKKSFKTFPETDRLRFTNDINL